MFVQRCGWENNHTILWRFGMVAWWHRARGQQKRHTRNQTKTRRWKCVEKIMSRTHTHTGLISRRYHTESTCALSPRGAAASAHGWEARRWSFPISHADGGDENWEDKSCTCTALPCACPIEDTWPGRGREGARKLCRFVHAGHWGMGMGKGHPHRIT